MIIIIPLGGIGKRFTDFGYETPKPLIRSHGKEIILKVVESFKLIPTDRIYIVYNKILDQYGFKDYFIHHKNVFLYKLEKNTKGPVETIDQIIKIIRNSSKDESLLLADGDTFYNRNILKSSDFNKLGGLFGGLFQYGLDLIAIMMVRNSTHPNYPLELQNLETQLQKDILHRKRMKMR